MSSDAPKLGTGLFGYRRSAVQEIMAEGDAILREADERLQAAEMRVSKLQEEIETLKRRNEQMSRQLGQIERYQADAEGAGPDGSPEPVETGRGARRRGRKR